MSIYGTGWINVLPAKTDNEGPTTGMIRLSLDGGGGASSFNYPVIFTAYQVQLGEKVQFLEGFKEFIHAYAFGKSLGQAQISGYVLAGADNILHRSFQDKLVKVYENQLRAYKAAKAGKLAMISGPGTNMVKGVVTGLTYNISGESSSIISFNMSMAIVSSALGVA